LRIRVHDGAIGGQSFDSPNRSERRGSGSTDGIGAGGLMFVADLGNRTIRLGSPQ